MIVSKKFIYEWYNKIIYIGLEEENSLNMILNNDQTNLMKEYLSKDSLITKLCFIKNEVKD